jgi:DNA-binding transcriptional ArsR family regulator
MKKSQININRVFDALGDPTRRAMVERLSDRPHSVSGLATPLNITLTAVGQHLQVLEECGLVRTEKVGRVRTCSIDSAGFQALERWIKDRRPAMEGKLDKLGELLGESSGDS